ncbi:hypothetical protein Dimus_015588, partial [Dionaea muscipula]
LDVQMIAAASSIQTPPVSVSVNEKEVSALSSATSTGESVEGKMEALEKKESPPPFMKSIDEIRSLSTVMQVFQSRWDELQKHLGFIENAIEEKEKLLVAPDKSQVQQQQQHSAKEECIKGTVVSNTNAEKAPDLSGTPEIDPMQASDSNKVSNISAMKASDFNKPSITNDVMKLSDCTVPFIADGVKASDSNKPFSINALKLPDSNTNTPSKVDATNASYSSKPSIITSIEAPDLSKPSSNASMKASDPSHIDAMITSGSEKPFNVSAMKELDSVKPSNIKAMEPCDSSKSNQEKPIDGKSNNDSICPGLEYICQKMLGSHLRKYISSHLSDYTKLRTEVPAALKIAPDPASLVLKCVGKFYITGSKAFSKVSHMNSVRQAALFVLEFFLLMGGCDEMEPSVKEEAENAAVAWRHRVIIEGGLLNASDVDARGLLLFVSCFGIPSIFSKDDLLRLIRLSNPREIGEALRKSTFLVPRIPGTQWRNTISVYFFTAIRDNFYCSMFSMIIYG